LEADFTFRFKFEARTTPRLHTVAHQPIMSVKM
jgi:hypothetical protein